MRKLSKLKHNRKLSALANGLRGQLKRMIWFRRIVKSYSTLCRFPSASTQGLIFGAEFRVYAMSIHVIYYRSNTDDNH